MKERPILFSTAMVQAILEGRKTMTRRIVKPQPNDDDNLTLGNYHPTMVDRQGEMFPGPEKFGLSNEQYSIPCPYGKPGDRLWVRETWQPIPPDAPFYPGYFYKADNPDTWYCFHKLWKPSIYMPRSASRITLEITNIRVERLRDISGQDACNEGIINKSVTHPADEFANLWESINGPESWKANPWVWVITFKMI